MRLSQENRANGLVDADYCLKVAHCMLNVFDEKEKENHGFNSLEMLMIKAVFDDIFENTIKERYKAGRDEVMNFLSTANNDLAINQSQDNIINFLNFLDRDH
ncbi:hypothetical protein BX659_10245 [Orenia metallireducens]|jgi:hypothetical protein|uniref:Uncharacterized protein n=1 Tax=Orenia metallireducens TaxID=1413210 RepID=A0A285F269_9FIRM|nr:hypothetical protein [Orenia metallireducens]PRX34730.1 hypothetical protein BX659_10245 [Orenia metallireducens]SNY05385.1 hypothetical protein SAMN06265827_10145 [Orenia metallireducens]